MTNVLQHLVLVVMLVTLAFIQCTLTAAAVTKSLYARPSFTTTAVNDFLSPTPASLRYDPKAKAMVFGGANTVHAKLRLRVPAVAGRVYEVVLNHAIVGAGWLTGNIDIRLLDTQGSVLSNVKTNNMATTLKRISGTTGYAGKTQTIVPAKGAAPGGTKWLEIEWHLSGTVPADGDRRIEVRGVEISQLGASSSSPAITTTTTTSTTTNPTTTSRTTDTTITATITTTTTTTTNPVTLVTTTSPAISEAVTANNKPTGSGKTTKVWIGACKQSLPYTHTHTYISLWTTHFVTVWCHAVVTTKPLDSRHVASHINPHFAHDVGDACLPPHSPGLHHQQLQNHSMPGLRSLPPP